MYTKILRKNFMKGKIYLCKNNLVEKKLLEIFIEKICLDTVTNRRYNRHNKSFFICNAFKNRNTRKNNTIKFNPSIKHFKIMIIQSFMFLIGNCYGFCLPMLLLIISNPPLSIYTTNKQITRKWTIIV